MEENIGEGVGMQAVFTSETNGPIYARSEDIPLNIEYSTSPYWHYNHASWGP